MAPRFKIDPVPEPVAGVLTLKCDCGWEMPFIMPEEHIFAMMIVFQHLKDKHGIEFPVIACFWH